MKIKIKQDLENKTFLRFIDYIEEKIINKQIQFLQELLDTEK